MKYPLSLALIADDLNRNSSKWTVSLRNCRFIWDYCIASTRCNYFILSILSVHFHRHCIVTPCFISEIQNDLIWYKCHFSDQQTVHTLYQFLLFQMGDVEFYTNQILPCRHCLWIKFHWGFHNISGLIINFLVLFCSQTIPVLKSFLSEIC